MPWKVFEGRPVGREAERAHVGGHVGQPQRSRQVAEILEQPRPVGPFQQLAVLLRGEARSDEVLGDAGIVDGGDGTVAGAGERAGALDNLVQHGLKVEARVDAQARRAERGDAAAQRRVLVRRPVAIAHPFSSLCPPPRPAGDSAPDRGCGGAISVQLLEIMQNSLTIRSIAS